jgi:uncharacterized membrane protein YbhN (UPF0104 family)
MSYYTLTIFIIAVLVISILGWQNATHRILKMVLSQYEWTMYASSLKRLIPGYAMYYLHRWKRQVKKETRKQKLKG